MTDVFNIGTSWILVPVVLQMYVCYAFSLASQLLLSQVYFLNSIVIMIVKARLHAEFLRMHRQTKIHNIGATLVGVDKFGNKYYERLEDTQFGRHRWVEYGDKGRYNASQVPPEWHGWLHFITDHTGDELLMLKPKRYGVEHRENFSGEGDEYIYHSKGHSLNPGQKDWTRYQPWQSTKA